MIDGAIAHNMVEAVQVNHPTNEMKMSKQNNAITGIKAIVHPKMKIVTICSPSCHQQITLVRETQKEIFGSRPQCCLGPNIIVNILFCIATKESHRGLIDMRVSKW